MTKNTARVLPVVAILALLLWSTGCGEEEKVEEVIPAEQIATTDGGDNLSSQIEGLKSQEMTVEVISNGKTNVIWSQKEGSWRWEDPADKNSYVIFNAPKNKMWLVKGNTASEISTAQSYQYMGMSPESLLKMYTALPATTRTEDTWEFDVPGQGKMTIEFKGPQGLPTKLVTTDATGKTDVVEFKYSNVGSVPDSLFELPAGVSVQEDGFGGGMGVTVPEL